MKKLNLIAMALGILLGPHAPVRAATANQRNAATHFQRGLELSLDNKWKAAEAEYRAAVQLDPQNPSYRIYLSDALAAQGQFQKAQQSNQQGKQLTKMGYKPTTIEKPKLVKIPPRIAKNPTTIRPSIEPPIVISEPTVTDGHLSEPGIPPIITTRETDKLPSKLEPLDKVIGNLPIGNATPEITVADPDSDPANLELNKAQDLYEEGKWLQAETEYRRVLRLHPQLFDGWNGLGDTYSQLNQWSEAEKAYREAVRLRPQESYFHAQHANALLKLKRRDEATKEAREAIRLGLEDHEVFDELGITPTAANR